MDERAVTASDRAFLLEVYADSRRDELACLGWSAEQTAHFVEMQFAIQQRGYQLQFPAAEHCILLCDGECAGQWRIQRREAAIVLVDIALLARFRGRGIGSARIAQLCQEAACRAMEVRLSVRPENRAYRLYRRLGFEESSRDETRVGLVWRSPSTRGSLTVSRSVDLGPFALEAQSPSQREEKRQWMHSWAR
jgi:GNAT superfamily N-acetyltransferase